MDAHAQGWLDKAKGAMKTVTGSSQTGFTEADAANAIKEALSQGTSKGTDILAKADGYFGNTAVKIPFPADAQKVEATLRRAGLGNQVDDAVLSINRAAEMAAIEAKPIFLEAIKAMTVQDAIAIVRGEERAATNYLQRGTTPALTQKFAPIIQAALEKTNATRYWSAVMSSYNRIPFVDKVNPDLTQYATAKAIEGLFTMIAQEEAVIRKDPAARATDLLKRVFGK